MRIVGVNWFGGKGRVLNHILPLIPNTQLFVDVYGGSGKVLFARHPSPVEVYNDLDDELVNLMRVMQSRSSCKAFQRRLKYTHYSRAEFDLALRSRSSSDSVERAWGFYVAFLQCFCGPHHKTIGHWGRALQLNKARAWLRHKQNIDLIHKRLSRCQIDNRTALTVIRYWDSENTTFYLDPPYIAETRKSLKVYKHETSAKHHKRLVRLLLHIKGSAVLSGYRHRIYNPLEDAGWVRHDFQITTSAASTARGTKLHGAGNASLHAPRTECVWQNPKAARLTQSHGLWSAS